MESQRLPHVFEKCNLGPRSKVLPLSPVAHKHGAKVVGGRKAASSANKPVGGRLLYVVS